MSEHAASREQELVSMETTEERLLLFGWLALCVRQRVHRRYIVTSVPKRVGESRIPDAQRLEERVHIGIVG